MRNPCPVLYVSQETARPIAEVDICNATSVAGREEGGDDTKSAWPFDALGCTRGTMAGTTGCQVVRRS